MAKKPIKRRRSEPEESKVPFEYHGFTERPSEPKGPQKGRHFEANYKWDLTLTGYCTGYELMMQEEEDGYKKVLKFLEHSHSQYDPEVTTFFKDAWIVRNDWQESGRMTKDLASITNYVRDKLIMIRGWGDELDDVFVIYALNGDVYYEPAEIVFPAFDYTKLGQRIYEREPV